MVFPLFGKSQEAGIFDTGDALIIAPTATGESYIGRTILRQAVQRREGGVNAYLVPYPETMEPAESWPAVKMHSVEGR